MTAPVDPWEVLRRIRALPLVAATEGDEPINGGDAVEELAALREILDEAIGGRPRAHDDRRVLPRRGDR